MTERTYPGTIASNLRAHLAATAERVTMVEERTGGDCRARFSAIVNGERFVVSVTREPSLADAHQAAERLTRLAENAERDGYAAVATAARAIAADLFGPPAPPRFDIEIAADGVPRATRALEPGDVASISLDALRAIERNHR